MSLSAPKLWPSALRDSSSLDETNEASAYEYMIATKSDHPLDIGIVFDSSGKNCCGHRFRLEPLVRYLDGADQGTHLQHQCPLCQKKIVRVYDGVVATHGHVDSTVIFRYNKQTFCLAVGNNNKRWWQRASQFTAQERIADVLAMNVKSCMKILCKGKVLYPTLKLSGPEISRQILELSKNDRLSKKPSLVVMGTRSSKELRSRHGVLDTWYGMVRWGFGILFQITKITVRLLLLPLHYLRSLPPSQNVNNNRGE